MIGGPYLALAAAGGIVVAATGGFFFGQSYHAGTVAKRDVAALNKAEADRKAAERRIGALERTNTMLENRRQTTVREIYRDIPRIVQADPATYGRVCINDDGVRALDKARAAVLGGDDPGAPAGEARGQGRAADPANGRP